MDPSDSEIRLLQGMPVFGGLRKETLRFLFRQAGQVRRPRGAYFFSEGDDGHAMFVLQSGTVAILKSWQGRQYLLKRMHAGDCFGEMEMLDLQPRTAAALAEEDCRALRFSTIALHRLYRYDAREFALIHMNMGREVTRRLRELDEHLFRDWARTESIQAYEKPGET